VKVLVVARWREDITWLADLPPGWLPEVVEKDVDVPNRGREPSSFLGAILQLYPVTEPADTFGFVQGNPFDHCLDLMARLTHPVEWFDPLGTHPYRSDTHGNPHHPGVPVGECHAKWLGGPMVGEVEFYAGGQFLLSGAALLSRPADWYRAMYDDLISRDDLSPWAAERLWPTIFARADG
jgi:hypothetical protein